MRQIKIDEMQQETKRRSHMRKMKDQMYDAQAQKAEVIAVETRRVADDKKAAIAMQNTLQHELLKI